MALVAGLALATSGGAAASPGQAVEDLTGPLTPADLANDLGGGGITISNVTFTGSETAAGRFTGFGPSVGFDSGVVLSTGKLVDPGGSVLGPNDDDGTSTDLASPGDPALDALVAPDTTNDAVVLEFDFVPTSSTVSFRYVFGSEEYNEFVNAFNDVFAFFINGTNCATVAGQPVSVDTINTTTNPSLFRNNDPSELTPPPIDAEPDGLTTTLTCSATVTPNAVNHLKLAIADTRDSSLDSVVFLETGSFVAQIPPVANDQTVVVAQDVARSVTLSATDANGDPLTFNVVTQPANGTLSGSAPNLTYTPAPGFSGTDSFTFTATDGVATSNVATVTIQVAPVVPIPLLPVQGLPFTAGALALTGWVCWRRRRRPVPPA